ncbi:MAG: Uma2 family endonuclease, partial [Gemmataceae bacterium]
RFKRFTLAQYQSMVEKGILTKEDKVELLNGWITNKMTINPEHSFATRRLATLLEALIFEGCHLRTQFPIALGRSQPEPDVAVVLGTDDRYARRHPSAAETRLIAEISNTSYEVDAELKLALYAAAGILQYWIVNLAEERFEIYSDPESASASYRQRADFGRGTTVPVVLGGVSFGELAVSAILPPKETSFHS